MELAKLTSADFAQHMGQEFFVHYGGEQPLVIRLGDVEDLNASVAAKGRAPFSLLFHGPKDYYVRQGVYTVEHPQMGRADIFIVPLGPDSLGMRYQITFG
jgi:hypothetical protein